MPDYDEREVQILRAATAVIIRQRYDKTTRRILYKIKNDKISFFLLQTVEAVQETTGGQEHEYEDTQELFPYPGNLL